MLSWQIPITQRIRNNETLAIEPIRIKATYVSEALSDKIAGFDGNPIIINAPTGSGKSTFIYNVLVKAAIDDSMLSRLNRAFGWEDNWILVLTNRIALHMQQYKDYCAQKSIQSTQPQEHSYCRFEHVVIATYQGLLTSQDHFGFQNAPKYIVFDEAHFFCSDSTYNPWTERILTTLMEKYPCSTRIYMTATPETVKVPIAYFEKEAYGLRLREHDYLSTKEFLDVTESLEKDKLDKLVANISGRKIIEYIIETPCPNLRPHFYKKDDDIIDCILKEKDVKSKWLVFVNSREDGKELQRLLNIRNIESDYLDASSDNNEKKALIRAHRFPKQVLIATSVIDNGISLFDDDLKNIVIDFFDKTQIMQMIGRKRLKANESIDIYLKVPSLGEISRRGNHCDALIRLISEFRQSPKVFFRQHWGSLSENEQRMFYPLFTGADEYGSHQVFSVNRFCEYQLCVLQEEYQELKTEMEFDPNAYAKKACQWFLLSFDPNMIIVDRTHEDMCDDISSIWAEEAKSQDALSVEELRIFLDKNLSFLTIETQKELELSKSGKDRDDERIPEKLRKIINEFKLPYVVKKLSKKEREQIEAQTDYLYYIKVLGKC